MEIVSQLLYEMSNPINFNRNHMCSQRCNLYIVVTMTPDIIRRGSACLQEKWKSMGSTDVLPQILKPQGGFQPHIGRVEVSIFLFKVGT